MGFANTAMDVFRQVLYRDSVKMAVHRLGLSDAIHSLYWAAIRQEIESPYPVSVGEAAASFGTPTYTAYRMATDAEGDEQHVLDHLLTSISPADTFYDIGANIGTYSCLVGSALDDRGTVVAIEPYPPNIGELYANIWRNGIDATVVPAAVGDRTGTFSLDIVNTTGVGSQQHSLAEDYRLDRVVDSIPVPVITGDEAIEENELPAPDIVKIDVEGVAPDVIHGMSALEHAHMIYIEPHDNRDEITTLISQMGFSVSELSTPPSGRDYLVGKSDTD